MVGLRKIKTLFTFFLLFFLLVVFLGLHLYDEVEASYSCLPQDCWNGPDTLYHVYTEGAMSGACVGPMDVTYNCSGSPASCSGGIGTHRGYFLDSGCNNPAQKWCCFGTACTPTSCGCSPGGCPSGYSEVTSSVYNNQTCPTQHTCSWTTRSCSNVDNCGDSCPGGSTRYCRRAVCNPHNCADIGQHTTCPVSADYGCVNQSFADGCGGNITCPVVCAAPTSTADPDSRGWTNQDINVEIEGDGEGCGVNRIRYCWSHGGTCDPNVNINASSGTVTQTVNGNDWRLCHRARNNNNAYGEVTCDGPYQIDKTPPEVWAEVDNEPEPIGDWQDEVITNVTVYASDPHDPSNGIYASGLAHVRYAWLNKGSSAPSWLASCTSGGTTLEDVEDGKNIGDVPHGGRVLYLCARDVAGNVTTWNREYNWCTPNDPGDPSSISIEAIWGTQRWLRILSETSDTPRRLPLLHSGNDVFANTFVPAINQGVVNSYYWTPGESNPTSCSTKVWYSYEFYPEGSDEPISSETIVHPDNANPADGFHKHALNLPALSHLRTEGASGSVIASYHTESKSGTVIDRPIERYFKVNNVPDFDCPDILEKDKGNLVSPGTTSYKDCSSTTYTGIEGNNPLHFKIEASDKDGVGDILGAFVWLSKKGKENEIPTYQEVGGSYGGAGKSDMDHIGGMIIRGNRNQEGLESDWNNPFIFLLDDLNENGNFSWRNTARINSPPSHNRMRNYKSQIVASVGGEVDADFDNGNITFVISFNLHEVDGWTHYIEGQYDVNVLVFDRVMLDGTTLDQYSIKGSGAKDPDQQDNCDDWRIDLRRPEFPGDDNPSRIPDKSELLKLSWDVDGTGSMITDIVINGYIASEDTDDKFADLKLHSDKTEGTIPLIKDIPDDLDSESGKLDDEDAFRVSPSPAPTYEDSVDIEIPEVNDGQIPFPITAFDQACNDRVEYEVIDLNPWVSSKGGLLYSKGSVGTSASSKDPYSFWHGIGEEGTVKDILNQRVSLVELLVGTELLSSASDRVSNAVYPSEEGIDLSVAIARNTPNALGTLRVGDDWFEDFKERLKTQIALGVSGAISRFWAEDDKLSDKVSEYEECTSQHCYVVWEEDPNNEEEQILKIEKGFTCDRNTLIMSDGNIYIDPDVSREGDGLEGCIFIAKDDVIIGEGDREGLGNPVEIEDTIYDRIDGYIIAGNQIQIPLVDEDRSLRHGLQVHGGLVAFGRDVREGDSAIEVNRSFRLFNLYLPVVATSWDVRYAKLSEIFFGSGAPLYKQEVGFKQF